MRVLSVLLAFLLAFPAVAKDHKVPDDTPIVVYTPPLEVVADAPTVDKNSEQRWNVGDVLLLPNGLWINQQALDNYNARTDQLQAEVVSLGVENEALRKAITSVATNPPTNWETAGVLVGVGLLGGIILGGAAVLILK